MGRQAVLQTLSMIVAVAVLPVVINLATDTVPDGWGPWLWLAWPATVVLVGLAVVLNAHSQRSAPAPAVEGDAARLEQAAEALAGAVRAQWSEEAAHRGLRLHDPLRVRWSAVGGRYGASPGVVLGAAVPPGRPLRLRARGDVADAVSGFRQLPREQLLVLGEPGSGKSSLSILLTVGLLERREPGEPVPVPVALSSWRPTGEHLYTWLARRLTHEYDFLGNTELYGPDAAFRLLDSGRVVPVLDGLDEMAAELRPVAIDHVNRFVQARPLVVTSRWDEYRVAADTAGQKIAFMAIQLDPVSLDEAERFLVDASDPADRWRPVLARLRADPELPPAAVLTSPLLLELARVGYGPAGTDTAELLDRDLFPDREHIERSLLASFVRVSYTTYPALPGQRRPGAARIPYDPERAHGWLTHLARHLHGLRADELAWWRLHLVVPRRGLVALAGGVCAVLAGPSIGLLAGLLFGARFVPTAGLASGLGIGLGTALLVGLRRGPAPARIQFGLRGRGDQLRRALALGLAAGPLAGMVFGLLFWLAGSVPRALEIGTTAGVVAGTVGGLGVGVMAALRGPIETTRVVEPMSLLRADRAAALVQAGAGGAAAGCAAGALAALNAGPGAPAGLPVVAGVGVAVGVGLVAVCTTAWGQWTLTRLWLLVRGRAPWRLMEFLDDAHRRGVLRQAGTVYLFRHALLQSHLATAPAARPVPLPGAQIPNA